ncbi:MAG: PfkB family carbohydrate kinase [archaeon]
MEKLKGALDKFGDKKILVMGDVCLDKFSWGSISRVNPEQPASPLVKISKESYVLGGAANVARNISSLGVECYLYGIVGRDFFGEKISQLCEENKIKFRTFYNQEPTIVKQRIMAHGQQVARFDHGEINLNKKSKEIDKKILGLLTKDLSGMDYVLLSDYNKHFFDEVLSKEIILLANSMNIPVLVDPKPMNVHFFKNCTVVRPNEKEAEIMTGIKYSNEKDVLAKIAEKLTEMTDSKYAVITCGKDGVFSYDRFQKEFRHVGTKAIEVRDTTGAGDTFAATLALGLSSGLGLFEAVKLGNYASGVVVEKVGTAVPTVDEIKKKIDQDNNF